MKITARIRNSVTGREWNEYYNPRVRTIPEAEQYMLDMIKRFNDTLRPGEKPRELVKITQGGEPS